MPNIQVIADGVEQLLRGIQIHKATGLDHISTRLHRKLASEMTPVFTVVYISSILQGPYYQKI